MKKLLFLAALVFATLQVNAANVDKTTAQQSAQRFLMSQTAQGRYMASTPTIKWTHEAKSINAQAAYYVVNTDRGYVIVSGDDRAREILAYGPNSLDDMNDLPGAMKLILKKYQKQLEYLQAHPDAKVQKRANRGGISVAPLFTTAWAQGKPYNMKTPKKGYGSDPYCKVGCAAVALAQVMNYWNYPATSPALPGYVTETHQYQIDALPEYTFDWEHMLDTYRTNTDQYSDQIIDAISWLMRYVGQAMNMDYATDQSGAEYDEIDQAIRTFGFDPGYSIQMKWDYDDGTVNYTEEEWAELVQSELVAGRPLIYCAFDMSSDSTGIGGHAFNVDGYDAETDLYHVNFGMSADKNTYYAMNAFTLDNGMTVYDFYPLIFANLQPPTGPAAPRMVVSPTTLNMECYAGENTTATFTVAGLDLTDDITVTVNDEAGVFTTDVATIAVADAASKTVTVTYAPQVVGTNNATITLSTPGGQDVTVTLNGTATAAPLEVYTPVMQPANEEKITLTSFRADWTDETPAENVASYTLEVNEKPGAGGLLAEADWSNVPSSGYANAYLPEGWEVGPYSIYNEGGSISITSDSYIRTNALDLSGFDKVTVVFSTKAYYSWTPSAITVKTSIDSEYYELTNANEFTEYTVVLDCTDSEQIEFFANSYYPQLKWVKIYAGELTAPALRAMEEGNETHRLITGITGKSYTVENLLAEGTFLYKVKAVYTDGTESAWSNTETVTLFDNAPAFIRGDVDGDGNVGIADVTALVDYILNGDEAEVNIAAADADQNGEIGISDVTALVDFLLSSAWE